MLLEACVAADVTSWALALGLVIEDVQTLAGSATNGGSDEALGVQVVEHLHVLALAAGIKQRHGDLWIETKMVLHRDSHLKPYLEVRR